MTDFFQFLLEAPSERTASRVSVYFKPVNEIEVEGRKINGTVGVVRGVNIFTGNSIFDFEYDTLVRMLMTPSENF